MSRCAICGAVQSGPERQRLPNRRPGWTVGRPFDPQGANGPECCITIGLNEARHPLEIFMHTAREDSAVGRIIDDAAILFSLALQYGVPAARIAKSLGRTADGRRTSIIGEAADAAVEIGREIVVVRGAAE